MPVYINTELVKKARFVNLVRRAKDEMKKQDKRKSGKIRRTRTHLSIEEISSVVTKHMAGSSFQMLTKVVDIMKNLNPSGHICLKHAVDEIVKMEVYK